MLYEVITDYKSEFESIKKRVNAERAMGREIVVVMGVGFVGAVMAAIVADTTDKSGKSSKFVIGMQRPSARSFWKIPMLNRGVSPVKAEDPEVRITSYNVCYTKLLRAGCFNNRGCP